MIEEIFNGFVIPELKEIQPEQEEYCNTANCMTLRCEDCLFSDDNIDSFYMWIDDDD